MVVHHNTHPSPAHHHHHHHHHHHDTLPTTTTTNCSPSLNNNNSSSNTISSSSSTTTITNTNPNSNASSIASASHRFFYMITIVIVIAFVINTLYQLLYLSGFIMDKTMIDQMHAQQLCDIHCCSTNNQQIFSTMTTATTTTTTTSTTINNKRGKFSFEIKVLAMDQLDALSRCLEALRDAKYDNHINNNKNTNLNSENKNGDNDDEEEQLLAERIGEIDLTVFVDHYDPNENMTVVTPSSPNNKHKTMIVTSRPMTMQEHETRRRMHEQILNYLMRSFKWPHGKLSVQYRHRAANKQFSWLESFYPLNNDTYALIMDDDMVVSPYYYLYLKKMISRYRYSSSSQDEKKTKKEQEPEEQENDQNNINQKKKKSEFTASQLSLDPSSLVASSIYGISLQRPTLVPGNPDTEATVNDNNNQPYLYQLVDTHALLVFPEHWLAFRKYFDERRLWSKKANVKPYLGGTVTDVWYRSAGESAWGPWMIRWAYANNYYSLYANLPNGLALAARYVPSPSKSSSSSPMATMNDNPTLLAHGSDQLLDNTILRTEDRQVWDDVSHKSLVESGELRRFDYCFHEVSHGEITFDLSDGDLSRLTFSNHHMVLIVVEDSPTGIKFLKNQLCYIEQHVFRNTEVSMKENLLFMTDSKSIAAELLYRGYKVVLKAKQHKLSDIVSAIIPQMTNAKDKLFIMELQRNLLRGIPVKSNTVTKANFVGSLTGFWVLLEGSNVGSVLRLDAYDTVTEFMDIHYDVVNKLDESQGVNAAVITGISKDVQLVISLDDYACKAIHCNRVEVSPIVVNSFKK